MNMIRDIIICGLLILIGLLTVFTLFARPDSFEEMEALKQSMWATTGPLFGLTTILVLWPRMKHNVKTTLFILGISGVAWSLSAQVYSHWIHTRVQARLGDKFAEMYRDYLAEKS